MGAKKKNLLLMAVIAFWLLGVVGGMGLLANYANSPGAPGGPPQRWPAVSRIQPDTVRATLVMVVHPHCPCSRASMAELARLMAQAEGRVKAYVLFTKPTNFSDGWEQTDLWSSAAAIPGVTVMRDDDGMEARHFNVATSGHTMVYQKDGSLVFSGGITAGRGHEGDNAGRSAIVSLLSTNEAERRETPIFGCALFEKDECPAGKEVGHAADSN